MHAPVPVTSARAGSGPGPDTPTPRVVASDLDGTLLRSDGSLSRRTARAWRSLKDVGILTVLVTARPPRWLDDLAEIVGAHGVAVCGNGAFVYDVGRRAVVETHGFARADLLAIVADLREAVPGIGFSAERASGPWTEPHYDHPQRGLGATSWIQAPIDELDDEPVGKLLALAPGLADDELRLRVEQVVGGRGVLAYSGALGLAEVGPPGVSKAVGLAAWCAGLGIGPEQVWAFGDMPNDIPMLSWAGTSYAVANGHPDALAAATHVCPANDDDGVAQVIEPLVNGGGPGGDRPALPLTPTTSSDKGLGLDH